MTIFIAVAASVLSVEAVEIREDHNFGEPHTVRRQDWQELLASYPKDR
jgi:hypothetical protein